MTLVLSHVLDYDGGNLPGAVGSDSMNETVLTKVTQWPREVRAGVSRRLRFIVGYLKQPHVVGAVSPSSRSLARTLCAPYRRAAGPSTVLEVGAGTGAITRELGRILRPQDRLDVCEISDEFADILERDVLSNSDFAPAVSEGRVRLIRSAVQDIEGERKYDFIISGLPFTAFELRDVKAVFAVIRRLLKPDGVFSYFEYAGMRKTSQVLAVGRRRRRVRSVSAYLTHNIRNHQFAQRIVLTNVPPACARYLRFNGNGKSRLPD